MLVSRGGLRDGCELLEVVFGNGETVRGDN
jgi:hypothetical protein